MRINEYSAIDKYLVLNTIDLIFILTTFYMFRLNQLCQFEQLSTYPQILRIKETKSEMRLLSTIV